MRKLLVTLIILLLLPTTQVFAAGSKPSVVVSGDSIAYIVWANAKFSQWTVFLQANNGLTSADVLNLFPHVISRHPTYNLISVGLNDIKKYPLSAVATIETNDMLMVTLARANNIVPVLSTLLPINTSIAKPAELAQYVDRIKQVNNWLRCYSAANHILLIDLYAAWPADPQVARLLYTDLFHPNLSGVAVVKQAILKGLPQ